MSDLAHSLLDTSARIIAEDERYVVVAVRVEKALLGDNLPLLRELSERATRRTRALVFGPQHCRTR